MKQISTVMIKIISIFIFAVLQFQNLFRICKHICLANQLLKHLPIYMRFLISERVCKFPLQPQMQQGTNIALLFSCQTYTLWMSSLLCKVVLNHIDVQWLLMRCHKSKSLMLSSGYNVQFSSYLKDAYVWVNICAMTPTFRKLAAA